MDKSRVQDLERQVASQKEQLVRYEKRIHDVVMAYKSLLKEKGALEASLSAVSTTTTTRKDDAGESEDNSELPTTSPDTAVASQEQIATVMNSLATLSAEKSRMEMSFQRDKKQLRVELQEKDQRIREWEEKAKQTVNKNKLEVEGLKSKLIVERHAREKETSDQLAMIKELQQLLSDERQAKESLQNQMVNLSGSLSGVQVSQKKYEEMQQEIEKLKGIELEREQQQSGGVTLEKLQEQIINMKHQHTTALKHEKDRTIKAEEEIRSISLFHEERVANLEARLAELSNTVGNYDRLRQKDQENIIVLKEKLLDATSSKSCPGTTDSENESIEDILGEIERLKQILLKENTKMKYPVDVSGLFSLSNDHVQCLNEQNALTRELAEFKLKFQSLADESLVQKQHISNLQDKITVLNKNIDDQEAELRQSSDQYSRDLKEIEDKWKHNMELALRANTEEMEQHLQKQRERSLKLLEEKDNEIKALKSSFDLFIPVVDSNGETHPMSPSSVEAPSTNFGSSDGKTNSQLLHYMHELARKDVEITSLRKSKHSAESAMRQAIKDKITSQEELHDKLADLEEQVGRWEIMLKGSQVQCNNFQLYLQTGSLQVEGGS